MAGRLKGITGNPANALLRPDSMRADLLAKTTSILKYVLLVGALSYVLVYLALALFRMGYPFELEWIEGGMLEHVRRVMAGQPLYIKPSLDFTAFIYTPLYYYVSAAVAWIFGMGFVQLRAVSFVASLGCLLLIFLIVRRETKSRFAGALACALFAATYRLSGTWLDLVRIDSLFLFFLLLAVYPARFGTSAFSALLAGLFIALAFLTKQTALFVFLTLAVYYLVCNRRIALAFIATGAVLIGGSTLLLDHLHNGWYNYYVFYLPARGSLVPDAVFMFWSRDLISPLAVAFTLGAIFMLVRFVGRPGKQDWFYIFLAAGAFGAAWVSRVHGGGVENVMIPAYAVVAIVFGVAVKETLEFIKAMPSDRQKLAEACLYVICSIQFFSLLYVPSLHIVPEPADSAAGQKLVERVAQMKGSVLIPYHPYLAVRAGKTGSAHNIAMSVVVQNDQGPGGVDLANEIRQAIQQHKFDIIILDGNKWSPFQEHIDKFYKLQSRVFDNPFVFWTKTGMYTRPEYIYVPKD
mgnify:FL=1